MLSQNHTPLTTLLTALASTKQGLPLLEAALRESMRNTQIYASAFAGQCVSPSLDLAAVVTQFHPHTIADAARLIAVASAKPVAEDVLVYAGEWTSPNTISIGDAPEVDLVPWRAPVISAPPVPAPPPAPPVPAPAPAPTPEVGGVPVPEALGGVLAQIDEAFSAPAAKPRVDADPLTPPEIIHEQSPRPSNVVQLPAAETTPLGWEGVSVHPDLPLTRLLPSPTGDKGRPKASPFAKAHPQRARVGAASPFWRDLLPLAPDLFVKSPGDLLPNGNLGTLEAFAQLLHVLAVALQDAPDECTVGHIKHYISTIQTEFEDCPCWPAVAHSLATYNSSKDAGNE